MNKFKSQTKFDINDIIKILPHRYPFILIDRIEITEPGKRLDALKNKKFLQERLQKKNLLPYYKLLHIEYLKQVTGTRP